jgi:tellurite resistance protein
MELFDDILGESQPQKVTKEMAYLGVLLLANNCDGAVSDEEARALGTAVSRMKMFQDMNGDQIGRILDRAVGFINRKGFDESLQVFARVIPEKLHKTAFANACDLILADGVVEAEEKKFINNLRSALGLSGDDAQTIAQVMVYKNQG